MSKQENILIIGAGLCGSLLALRLGQRGYKVRVIEMRPDLRTVDISAGRSINLAFSNRGRKAIKLVGLESKVASLCIPMHGRMIHDTAPLFSTVLMLGVPSAYVSSSWLL